MAKRNNRRQTKQTYSSGRRKSCAFCRDKVEQIDYKDFQSLRRYLSDPAREMPGTLMPVQVTDPRDLDDLLNYLETLRGPPGAGGK